MREKYVDEALDLPPSEDPALKKFSSETSDLERSLVRLTVGGGVTKTFLPSDDPLEIVTGEPPKAPNIPLAPLARSRADLNSSSKSANELLRLKEFPRVGVITRESPG